MNDFSRLLKLSVSSPVLAFSCLRICRMYSTKQQILSTQHRSQDFLSDPYSVKEKEIMKTRLVTRYVNEVVNRIMLTFPVTGRFIEMHSILWFLNARLWLKCNPMVLSSQSLNSSHLSLSSFSLLGQCKSALKIGQGKVSDPL